VVLVEATEVAGAEVGAVVRVDVELPPTSAHFKKGALCTVARVWQNRHWPLWKQPRPSAEQVGLVAATAEIPTPWSPTDTSDTQSTADSSELVTATLVFTAGALSTDETWTSAHSLRCPASVVFDTLQNRH